MDPSIDMKLFELVFGDYRCKYYRIKKPYYKVLKRYIPVN